jgi:tryptophan-rich sensory protein
MCSRLHARKLAAVFCLALLLVAALIPAASGLLYAIPALLWLFFAAIVTVSIRRAIEEDSPQRTAFLSILASRAPPIA